MANPLDKVLDLPLRFPSGVLQLFLTQWPREVEARKNTSIAGCSLTPKVYKILLKLGFHLGYWHILTDTGTY
jgi:hypothetical protein